MFWGHAGAPHDDGVAFDVDAAAACASGQLGVLAGGDVYVGFAVVFGELFQDDGTGGHVDAQCEGFGGEDQLDEALREEGFDDLLEQGQQACVVRGDTANQAVTPLVVAEGVQVAGVQVSGRFRNVGADGLLLFGGGQRNIGGYAVADRAVATGTGEDKADCGQQALLVEGAHHLRAGDALRTQRLLLTARIKISVVTETVTTVRAAALAAAERLIEPAFTAVTETFTLAAVASAARARTEAGA